MTQRMQSVRKEGGEREETDWEKKRLVHSSHSDLSASIKNVSVILNIVNG